MLETDQLLGGRPGPAGQRWLHAVRWGGEGRYARAAAVLLAVLADPATPPGIAAHAAVTLASHRRQQGGHTAARSLDARGLATASAAPPEPPHVDGLDTGAAVVDALVGLAADAAGLGDVDAARRLLDAARARRHPSWRPAVRLLWVQAELDLFAGHPERASGPAGRALQIARTAGSDRHLLKSRLVDAVVRAVVHPDGAVLAELDDVAAIAASRYRPLEWPARLAAADLVGRLRALSVTESSPAAHDSMRSVTDASPNERLTAEARRRHAAVSAVNVLYQSSDGPGRRLMGESPYVPLRLPLV